MLRSIAGSILALLCASCASLNFDAPAEEFGPRPPAAQLKATADQVLQTTMFDPESKRQRWVDPVPLRAALWRGLIGGGWNHGWGMRFYLNGKNRFGGYVGEKPYYVIQVGEEVYVGEVWDNFEVDSRPAAPAR